MNKSQCYAEISRNQNLITEYQNEINQLNVEISEITTAKGNVSGLGSTLSDCQAQSTGKLAGFHTVSKLNTKMVSTFYNGMSDLLTGTDYTRATNGLENVVTRFTREINDRNNRINALNTNISNCQDRIGEMESRIAQIEREEARERERRAAEEAQRARDAAENAANNQKRMR